MGQLDGKVAIVTGGGRGIGARYCRGLAAEGEPACGASLPEAELAPPAAFGCAGAAAAPPASRPDDRGAATGDPVASHARGSLPYGCSVRRPPELLH